MAKVILPTIRELYPHLDNKQLKEIEENLEEYLKIVLRIYERVRDDPVAYNRFKVLTALLQKSYNTEQKVDCSSINTS